MTPKIDARLLLLDPRDNVLVARARVAQGELLTVDGAACVCDAAIPLGHKIARRKIAPGEKVIKYGASIGSAIAAIPPGAHVHSHNVKSDYTPTYTLDDAREAAS